METLLIYNKGRDIHIEMNNMHIQYTGSKALEKFIRVNRFNNGVIYLQTKFKYGEEEDYIDLNDILTEFNYDSDKIIESIGDIKIQEDIVMTNQKENIKQNLIDRAILVSDNLALIPHRGSANDLQIEVVSMSKTSAKALIRFNDMRILQSNMSEQMKKRAVDTIVRNREIIVDELKEAYQNA